MSVLNLRQLIARLERENPDKVVRSGFHNPHSYRGYYEQLAFEPKDNARVGDMLAAAQAALGETYTGWKGGDFKMDGYTECWIAHEGCTSSDPLSYMLIDFMLADAAPAPTTPQTKEAQEGGATGEDQQS